MPKREFEHDAVSPGDICRIALIDRVSETSNDADDRSEGSSERTDHSTITGDTASEVTENPREVRQNASVQAVVLDVNSPGGTTAASERSTSQSNVPNSRCRS